jgi:Fur family ferric uptake transcriptional regulator
MVRRRLPKISLGTVYRNLDLLAEAGKIQRLDLGGSEARFDADTDAHYHVRCVRCGRVDDVPGLPADLVADGMATAAGYEILGHRLEFVGICPQCKTQ